VNIRWQDLLQKQIQQLPKDEWRVAVMGIGHELRGDDAAGLLVARALQPSANDNFLVVEAGHAPENYTAPVRRFAPQLVLLVDAAELQAPPGTIRWLEWPETTGLSASTHTMPLYLLARYLAMEGKCVVGLIGIQPADTGLNMPVSAEVEAAVTAVVEELQGAVVRRVR
jgi:hydrogenase maturation protease HycI